MQDAKEEVRARLAIEDVIGEYIQLKRAGRNFKGLSPFTSEKTPSFVVSPEKQIWHDFSSGKGGDIFSFVMEAEGIGFREALEQLASRAGVDLSLYQSVKAGEFTKKKQRFLEINKLAARYYQQCLLKNEHALDYVFKKRGLDKAVVSEFQIGYAPSQNDALVQFLSKRGYQKSEIKAAGLTNRFGGDLFRERMMIPLMDQAGQVIGFTARLIRDIENAPKYLNTPETILYDKSRHVFGLSQAKNAIRDEGYAVLVEGNLDVVSSHQAGVKQVVATAGTALTEFHLKSLVRQSEDIRLAFDGDKAGIAATERAIPIAQSVGANLSVIVLPDSVNDPDELIKQDVKLWQGAINSQIPAIDWLLDQYKTRVNMESGIGKQHYADMGMVLLRRVSNPVIQEHYLQKMVNETDLSYETLRKSFDQQPVKESSQTQKKTLNTKSKTQPASIAERYQDNLLAILQIDPSLRVEFKTVESEIFVGEARRALFKYLVDSNEVVDDTPPELQEWSDYVKMLPLATEADYLEWSREERRTGAVELLKRIKKEHRNSQLKLLKQKMNEASSAQEARKFLEQINELMKEMRHG